MAGPAPQGANASAAASAPPAKVGRWLAIALAIIVLDQLTKVYFNTSYQYGERLNLLPFFDFTLLYNRGAAFSFLASEDCLLYTSDAADE